MYVDDVDIDMVDADIQYSGLDIHFTRGPRPAPALEDCGAPASAAVGVTARTSICH